MSVNTNSCRDCVVCVQVYGSQDGSSDQSSSRQTLSSTRWISSDAVRSASQTIPCQFRLTNVTRQHASPRGLSELLPGQAISGRPVFLDGTKLSSGFWLLCVL